MKTHLVPFHRETITTFETPDGIYIAVAPLCERFGVSRQGQQKKLNGAKSVWAVQHMLLETPAGPRETLCIPLNRLAMWLASISPSKIHAQYREALIAYQIEAADVLDRHFRLRQRETECEIARLREQKRRMRAYLLAFNRNWNCISRLQEAGIERGQVEGFFTGKTRLWLGVQLDQMEASGAIEAADWADAEALALPPEPPAQGELPLTPVEAMQQEMAAQLGEA